MQVTYKNTFLDGMAFACLQLRRRFVMQMITIVYVVITSNSVLNAIPDHAAYFKKMILFALMEGMFVGAYVFMLVTITALGLVSKMNKTFLTDHTITIDEKGLTEETVYNRSEFNWNCIQDLYRSKRYLYVYIAQNAAHVIPRRAFATDAEWESFCGNTEDMYARHKAPE